MIQAFFETVRARSNKPPISFFTSLNTPSPVSSPFQSNNGMHKKKFLSFPISPHHLQIVHPILHIFAILKLQFSVVTIWRSCNFES